MNLQIVELKNEIAKTVVGKDAAIQNVIIALMCGGHVLIEDVPGVGKTRLASALARAVGGKFTRVQLTPDIMPSDILGFSLINKNTNKLEYREGAIMSNFLLSDEINRASPKVQSALLEAMEEFQATIDGITHKLPVPFMVLATQNPVETSGTYRLPEAQIDRFFMKVSMGYPTKEEEFAILDNNYQISNIAHKPVVGIDKILQLKAEIANVKVDNNIKKYIVELVSASRNDDDLTLGISPRGSISLYLAAKANAFIYERDFVIPEDVKKVSTTVLSHRLILSAKGKTKYKSNIDYILSVLNEVKVPI